MRKLLNIKNALILIFVLGFILRFYHLGDSPAGFHADEAAFGYNAYSILHTLKDEYGKFLPISLKSFGDYKGALYAYLDIPFIAVLGLTTFAARVPSALFESLTILMIYFFTERLLNNRRLALISAFIFAILPWDLTLSRVAAEHNVTIFFAMVMAYSLLRLKEKYSLPWAITAFFSASLTIISYTAGRFLVVLMLVLFLAFSTTWKKKKPIFNKSIIALTILMFIFGIAYTVIASTSRFSQVSIFSSPQTNLVMEEQIREDQNNPTYITRIFHNKVVNYARAIMSNAGEYFTFDYLFLNGGYPKRERIPNAGLLYIWELPFLLFGLYIILARRSKNELFLTAWWLIFLVPAFMTFDEIPNVHRDIMAIPAITIIVSIGLYESYKILRKLKVFPILLTALLLIGLFEFSYFEHQYFVHFDVHQEWNRGFAYKKFVTEINKYYPKYEKIIVTKANQSPYIYILFFSKYDPAKYQAEGSPRDLDYTGFDKYLFLPVDCPLNGGKTGEDEIKGKPGILYIDAGQCVTPKYNTRLLSTIRWKDNSPAFKLLEYVATGSASPQNYKQ